MLALLPSAVWKRVLLGSFTSNSPFRNTFNYSLSLALWSPRCVWLSARLTFCGAIWIWFKLLPPASTSFSTSSLPSLKFKWALTGMTVKMLWVKFIYIAPFCRVSITKCFVRQWTQSENKNATSRKACLVITCCLISSWSSMVLLWMAIQKSETG